MSEYNGTYPIAGTIKTKKLTAAADTYYIGMPVAYNDTNDNYEYSASAIQGIVWEDKTLSSEGLLLVAVSGSEILESALVDDSDAALTVTDDLRNSALTNGIILR